MAFRRGGFKGKGKKGSFTRVGNMFKSDKEYIPKGAAFSYSTTVSGEYLTPVVEALNKAAEEGGAVRFSLTKWQDQEHPVLSISPAQAKAGKRISKAKEDDGLQEDEGQDID